MTLTALQALGSLPDRVFQETLIGKSVNRITAMARVSSGIRVMAKEIRDGWKMDYKCQRNSVPVNNSSHCSLGACAGKAIQVTSLLGAEAAEDNGMPSSEPGRMAKETPARPLS